MFGFVSKFINKGWSTYRGMNRLLIIGLVLVVLTMLIGFLWGKLGKKSHPSIDETVWPSGTIEDEKNSLVYIGDLPKHAVLDEYTLVWGDYAPNYPVRLPPGTRFSKTGAIILPSFTNPNYVKSLDKIEEILLGSVKPSWKEWSRLEDEEGYAVIRLSPGIDVWIAARGISSH